MSIPFAKYLPDIIQSTDIYSVVSIYSTPGLILELSVWEKTNMVIAIMLPCFLQENKTSNEHTNQFKIKSVMKIMRRNAMKACNKKIWPEKVAVRNDS